MADLRIPRKPYGSLLLEGADQVAIEFFENDESSVDPNFELSFDDRAAQAAALGPFAEIDERFARGGVYVNALNAERSMRDAHADAVWDRLVAVKRRYDPEGVFSAHGIG